MSRRRRNSPNHIPPIERFCVRREDAAALFSISPSLFDELIAEGVFPPPKYLHSVPVWDVRKLLIAWHKYLGDDDDKGGDPWARAAL
jgi:hypothetical protein